MYGEIVAIVGDADMYCIACARKRYGKLRVAGAERGIWRGKPIDAINGYGPQDREGNVLGVVLADSEDALDIDGPADRYGVRGPRHCGDCGAALVEDAREPDDDSDDDTPRGGRYAVELQHIIHDATRHHEYWNLAGGDGPDPIGCALIDLRAAVAELERMRDHEHRWGSDDYCTICGADGRA